MFLLFFVSCIFCEQLKSTPAGKYWLYASALICGFGQSLLWLPQGCYLPLCHPNSDQEVGVAFAIFGMCNNPNIFIGNLLMLLFGCGETAGKIMLSLLTGLAAIGACLFFGLEPKKEPVSPTTANEKKGQNKRFLHDTILLLPAMCYFGIFISFSFVLQTFFEEEKQRYFISALYGLAMFIASAAASFCMANLRRWICAALLLHATGYALLFALSLQTTTLRAICLTICIGCADSIFITTLYTHIAKIFADRLAAAMCIFSILNGIASGAFLFQKFWPREWLLILLLTAIPAYIGMLGRG